MNVRTLLAVYAVLIAIGGLFWLLAPAQFLGMYGIDAPEYVAVLLGRFAGSMAVSFGVMAWLARDMPASPARDTLVIGITLANALGFAVCLPGALSGVFNASAWVPVISYAVFTGLFVVVARPDVMLRAAMAPVP